MLTLNNVAIEWLGHAGFKIKGGGKIIYIDPFEVKEDEPADIILITHKHYDHYSPEDLKKVMALNTTVCLSQDIAEDFIKNFDNPIQIVKPGDLFTIKNVQIKTTPAYNLNKKYHQSVGWVGYIVIVNNTKIYHAGDTDAIPELEGLKEESIDVALLPVSGTYVMTAEEAAGLANKIRPRIAVPMHCGKIVGTMDDAKRFAKLCKCKVEVMKPK